MRYGRRSAALGGPLCIVVLCALVLFPAAAAFAATASIEGKRVFHVAGPGEKNDVNISLSGSDYSISDSATISAGPGCSASGGNATCPAAGIIGITVSAGDDADNVENNTSTPSTLSGGDGNDSLEGGSGDDILRGNKGVDTHAGGAGDDFIDSRGNRGDVISCGIGNDTVIADAADTVAADCETVSRDAPPAGSASGPSPAGAALLGPNETDRLDRGACARDRLGTPGNDLLEGTALGDDLFGLQGNDILNGLSGDDCLFGGVGADRLIGADGDDRLLGDDSKKGVGGSDRLFGKAGDDLLVGGSARDRLSGGSGADRLAGDAGNDRLSGGKGKDRLTAGKGRDRLLGGPGKDRLNAAGGGVDRLSCGPGRDSARADRADRVRGCERVHRVG